MKGTGSNKDGRPGVGPSGWGDLRAAFLLFLSFLSPFRVQQASQDPGPPSLTPGRFRVSLFCFFTLLS